MCRLLTDKTVNNDEMAEPIEVPFHLPTLQENRCDDTQTKYLSFNYDKN